MYTSYGCSKKTVTIELFCRLLIWYGAMAYLSISQRINALFKFKFLSLNTNSCKIFSNAGNVLGFSWWWIIQRFATFVRHCNFVSKKSVSAPIMGFFGCTTPKVAVRILQNYIWSAVIKNTYRKDFMFFEVVTLDLWQRLCFRELRSDTSKELTKIFTFSRTCHTNLMQCIGFLELSA